MKLQASKAQWILVVSSGAFLAFVLFVYQAFGIHQGVSFSGHTLLERVLIFGLGASLSFALNEFLLKPKLRMQSVPSTVIWVLWEVLVAGTVTHTIFNYFWNWTETTWSSYFLLMGEISTVFIVPFSLYYLFLRQEKSLSSKNQLFKFKSATGTEEIVVDSRHLLYVKAEDNYVSIVYSSKGEEKSTVIRKKLSSLLEEYPQLKRVHRSYVINPETIQRIEKKSKSMKVHFETGGSVPVSESFREALMSL